MNFINKILHGLKRIMFDLVLLGLLISAMVLLPTPQRRGLEWLMLKAAQVSAGFLHAHIMRKLAFPKVNWYDNDRAWLKGMVIALYVVVIFAYARGG